MLFCAEDGAEKDKKTSVFKDGYDIFPQVLVLRCKAWNSCEACVDLTIAARWFYDIRSCMPTMTYRNLSRISINGHRIYRCDGSRHLNYLETL